MVRETLMALLVLCFAVAGCDDGPPVIEWPDAEPDSGADADADTDGTVDAGCQYDDECEDGVDCTDDTCDRSTGLCDHTPNHESCHDDSQCNGYEYCDSLLGCQPGIPYPQCNDHNACSIDICLEPTNPDLLPTCQHLPMDRDGDGHVDVHCLTEVGNPEAPRGDDCDDLDPLKYPGAGEFCFDGVDNDCDEVVDLADDDCTLRNDTCADAIELIAGRRTEGFTLGALGEDNTSCGWMGYADVVYWFVVPEDADVTLEVWGIDIGDGMGAFYPYVSVQTVCGNRTSEVRCQSGSYVRFFERGMLAGTYYVVVEGWSEGAFQMMLDVEEPTPPPEGDTCDTPIDLGSGESHTANLADYSGDAPISCMWSSAYQDVVYSITLDEPADVRYEVSAEGLWPYVALTETCGSPSDELGCGSNANPLVRTYCALPAGTYSLVVSAAETGLATTTVELAPPGEPPPNDARAGAIDVSAGGAFAGTLLCTDLDETAPSCEYAGHHDAFYTFTLDEAQDVELTLTAADGLTPTLAVQRDCGLPSDELFCQRSAPASRLMRSLPAGTYTVVVAGEFQADFELDVAFSAPTSVCEGAEVITESDTFTGSTSGAGDDLRASCGSRGQGSDVTYQVDLAEPSDLHAEITTADFDTMVHLRAACDDPCSEVACNDWFGGSWWASAIDVPGLDAGTYFLTVDAPAWWDGTYTLDVEITPL
jgi:hypothetical protein